MCARGFLSQAVVGQLQLAETKVELAEAQVELAETRLPSLLPRLRVNSLCVLSAASPSDAVQQAISGLTAVRVTFPATDAPLVLRDEVPSAYAAAMGKVAKVDPLRARDVINEAQMERLYLREFFAPIDRPTAAIVVATSKAEKDWLPERWAQVIDVLYEDYGLQPVLVGGRSERELAAERQKLAAERAARAASSPRTRQRAAAQRQR